MVVCDPREGEAEETDGDHCSYDKHCELGFERELSEKAEDALASTFFLFGRLFSRLPLALIVLGGVSVPNALFVFVLFQNKPRSCCWVV